MATTALRFSDGPVDETVFTSTQALNNFDAEGFANVLRIVFAFLTQQGQPAAIMAQLDAFAEQRRINNAQLKTLVRSLLTVLKASLRKNLPPKTVQEDFAQLGLAPERAEEVARLWAANLVAMSRTVIGQTLMVNKLIDMDWRFGVTAGTDGLRQAGTTFLQLKLVLDKGSKTENVFMELSLPQFYQFLKDMEVAKSSLEYFS